MLNISWITVFDAISCGYPKSCPSCLRCPCQPPNQSALDVQVCLVATFGSLLPFCLAPPRWEVAWVASREQSHIKTKREKGTSSTQNYLWEEICFQEGTATKTAFCFSILTFWSFQRKLVAWQRSNGPYLYEGAGIFAVRQPVSGNEAASSTKVMAVEGQEQDPLGLFLCFIE